MSGWAKENFIPLCVSLKTTSLFSLVCVSLEMCGFFLVERGEKMIG